MSGRLATAAGLILLLWLGVAAEARAAARAHWVASWASAQQIPEDRNAMRPEDLEDATLRQIIRLSVGGERIRLRLSNAFGTAPLTIDSIYVARGTLGHARIDPATRRRVTFGGRASVTIPAGATYVSDPVMLPVPALSHVAVSFHLPQAPARQTSHPGSRATTFHVHGDHAADDDLPNAQRIAHWYQLAGIDVEAPPEAGVIVAIGDSITDGHGVVIDTDTRWTDFLAERLQADPATRHIAVVNAGIGGGRVLEDGLGPNASARFERDVLNQPGVRWAIVVEGVNDLGVLTRDAPATPEQHRALVENIITAYRQMIERAREHGIRIIGATILPYGGSGYYHPGIESEADRQEINAWIRAPGHFDAVIDFDAATRDPADPTRLRADVDLGDGLHPSPAGYRIMADAIPLSLFVEGAAAAGASADDGPALAFTFDDLPAHLPLPPGVTATETVASIATTLRDAGIEGVYGFVNGAGVAGEASLAAALDAWRAAGQLLGNHGWSHLNLNQVDLDLYVREIEAGETLLAAHMGNRDWRWYRYPFLAEGDDPAKRAAVREALARRHYRIAAVTMSFDDYLWNPPYARCRAAGDVGAIAELERTYLAAAREAIDYYRALARELYGRDIPYVLLMHAGAFDAHMLPRLIGLYREAGFRFVSLDEAERDPVYAADLDPSLRPLPGMGARLAAAGAVPRQRHDYAPQLAAMCAGGG
jgi:lysophospholipase L1-like esterase/peptidoglycan/xylan/chitin deacetylase (PgdA/CDA1 family)